MRRPERGRERHRHCRKIKIVETREGEKRDEYIGRLAEKIALIFLLCFARLHGALSCTVSYALLVP